MGDRIDRSGIEDERDERTGRNAASERIRNQARWVDLQVQEAMRRGDAALNAMSPGASEQRVSVEFYEVPVQTVAD